MISVFKESSVILKKIKPLLIIMFILTLVSLGAGFYMSQSSFPIIESLKDSLIAQIEDTKAIQDILKALIDKNVLYATFYTAIYNTVFGAFLSTTLTGLFFPITVLVMVERGFFIGLLYGDIAGNGWYYLLLFGTIILEFGAYVLSSSMGLNIGLSLFWPKKFYKTKNRWKAFKLAWIDAFRVYPFIFVILIVAAIWEIGGIYLLMK